MWIDKMRQAASSLIDMWHTKGTLADEWMNAFFALEQALAAIPDEHEMVTLLRWLDEQDDVILFAAKDDIMDFILDRFGYKLPEEVRDD